MPSAGRGAGVGAALAGTGAALAGTGVAPARVGGGALARVGGGAPARVGGGALARVGGGALARVGGGAPGGRIVTCPGEAAGAAASWPDASGSVAAAFSGKGGVGGAGCAGPLPGVGGRSRTAPEVTGAVSASGVARGAEMPDAGRLSAGDGGAGAVGAVARWADAG